MLGRAGYTTVAVVDEVHWLDPKYGFARGFDHYRRVPDSATWKVDASLGLLDDLGEEPFFLFAHFYDAHSDWRRLPYEADSLDAERFAGWYTGDFNGCIEDLGCASQLLVELKERGESLDAEDRRYLASLYDAGLHGLDRELGRLFRGMEERGLFDNTIVLLTADHGEAFFEHGEGLHAQVYEETLAVPFLLRIPGRAGGTIDEVVSLVDITPTLLDLVGVPPLPGQGLSLGPILEGGKLDDARVGILFDDKQGNLSLRTANWALLATPGGPELYDVHRDPGQTNNLLATPTPPPVMTELEAHLTRERELRELLHRSFEPGENTVPLTEEDRAVLEALGYTGD